MKITTKLGLAGIATMSGGMLFLLQKGITTKEVLYAGIALGIGIGTSITSLILSRQLKKYKKALASIINTNALARTITSDFNIEVKTETQSGYAHHPLNPQENSYDKRTTEIDGDVFVNAEGKVDSMARLNITSPNL